MAKRKKLTKTVGKNAICPQKLWVLAELESFLKGLVAYRLSTFYSVLYP